MFPLCLLTKPSLRALTDSARNLTFAPIYAGLPDEMVYSNRSQVQGWRGLATRDALFHEHTVAIDPPDIDLSAAFNE